MARDSHLIGKDLAHYARQVGEQLERDYEEDCKRADEHAKRSKEAHERHVKYYARVTPVGNGYRAECIEPHPLVGKIVAYGRMPDYAVRELRYSYAKLLYSLKYVPTFDDARRYACRATFERVSEF